jgi:PAS domain S-box-containing protein
VENKSEYEELEFRVKALEADVLKQIQASETLRQNEEIYRMVIDNSREAIFVVQDGDLKFMNAVAVELTGISTDTSLNRQPNRPYAEWLHPDDQDKVAKNYLKRIRGEKVSSEYDVRVIDKNKNLRWVTLRSNRIMWKGRPATLNFMADITKRRQAEEALRKSEKRLRDFLENLGDVAYEADSSGNVIYANKLAEMITGMALKDILNKSFLPLFTKQSQEIAMDVYQRTLLGESPEYELTFVNGRTCHFKNEPLRDTEDNIVGVFGIARDITERKQAEEALRHTEEKYRLLIDSSDNPITVFDRDGRLILINMKGAKNLGAMPEDLVGKSMHEIFPYRADILLERNRRIMESGTGQYFEDAIELPSGKRWFWSNLQPVKSPEGKIHAVQIISYDITERRRAEEALRRAHEELEQRVQERTAELEVVNKELKKGIHERTLTEDALKDSEEKYRTILESMEEGYYEVDVLGNFTFFNDSMCRILGYSKDELMGMNNRQFMDQENAKKAFEVFNRVYTTGQPDKGADWRILKKDGAKRDIEVSVSLRKNKENAPAGFRGVARDITERREVEDAIRKSESKYRLLAENMSDIIWSLDLKGRLTYISPSVENSLGFTPEEAVQQPLNRIFTPASRKTVIKNISEMLKNEKSGTPAKVPKTLELEYIHKDGSTVKAELVCTALRDKDGKMIGFTGMTRDITKRKRAEERLRDSEKTARALINAPTDSALLIDAEGTVIDINEIAAQRLKTTVDGIKGKCIYDFFPQDVSELRKKRAGQVISTGASVRFEDMRFGRHMDSRIFPVFDSTGRVTRLAVFGSDITDRKLTEEALKIREQELEIKNKILEETNIALKVLLQKKEAYKVEFENKVLSNVKELVIPYLGRLKSTLSDETSKTYLNILESNLKDIISPFLQRLSINNSNLTPAQIQVANLVKDGKTTREMADLLCISEKTIQDHRKSIRKKLGIINKKVNLKSYLLAFDETGPY